jgi:cytochrome P450
MCANIIKVHPPVVNLFSRITPPSGDTVTIANTTHQIPGNTLIGYSAWSMHRNNRVLYGSDAPVFRPERWLDVDDAARLAQMTKTNDMIFGHGRWVCLGRNVALIEIHKCVFELFRRFDFALLEPARPWETFNSMGLWEIRDLWVGVTERE